MTVFVIHIIMSFLLLCMYNTVGSLRKEGGRRHHEGPHRYDMMMQIENKRE